MSRLLRMLLLMVSFLGVCSAPVHAQREHAREQAVRHGWRINYAAGLEEARRTSKPILLVFRCVT